MNIRELKELITKYAEEVCENEGYELVEVELHPGSKGLVVTIFIDKDGGVTVRDCELFSRSIEALLDVEDPIKGSYVLEVSSPGLDRPLKTKRDFSKNLGRNVKITTKEKIADKTFFIGKVIDVGDDWIRLEVKSERVKGSKKSEKGELLFIPLDKILKAQIYIG